MLFQPGTHVGVYAIGRHIGAGRVADVYEARTPDGHRRALKITKAGEPLASKRPARGAQESEAIATIEAVNVVHFYDSGVFEGRAWLLLELVEGPDLGQLARNEGGKLPIERAVSIVRQACDGVAVAHARNILHRDLRPANILIADGDLVKVTDFGSAKFEGFGVQTTDEEDLALSLYMAPEFIAHRVAQPASDVYSMALILYEVLTGASPIAPPTASRLVVCARQLELVPPPLESLGLGIPHDVSRLVERALSKKPEGRPSMRELADGLGEALHLLLARRRAAARAVSLPNGDPRLAPTEQMMAIPASTSGETAQTPPRASGGTVIMPAVAEVPARGASRDALPPPAPAPSMPPSAPETRRSMQDTRTVPLAAPGGPAAAPERGSRPSSTVPVEREASRPSRGPRALPAALGALGTLLLVGMAGAGWLFFGGGGAVPAAAPPAPPPAPTASASAPRAKPPAPPHGHHPGAPAGKLPP